MAVTFLGAGVPMDDHLGLDTKSTTHFVEYVKSAVPGVVCKVIHEAEDDIA